MQNQTAHRVQSWDGQLDGDAAAFRTAAAGNDAAPADADFQRLTRPLPLLSPRRWAFAVMRLLLGTAGRLSRGIRIGWRSGFDSGAMLDYVYRNRAEGRGWLGRAIDRLYLNSPGWRGIRQRRAHLEETLDNAIAAVYREGRAVRVLDIAAGHGRYVLEALKRRPDIQAAALLRDYSPANVEAGRALAATLGVADVAFEAGDAFDAASLAAVWPRPSIAVVSGLYELFPDNTPIRASLGGLHQALQADGYLIYTNQPWHPQLEFIARVLPSHRDGAPWVMRCRSQAEMDGLVREAGFETLATVADDAGIFTVSLARKI